MIGPLAKLSGGNPLHLIQALRLLAEGGVALDLPLADLVATRVGRLPSSALALLQGICINGLACPVSLARILTRSHDDPRAALQLLVRRGYVQHGSTSVLIVTHRVITNTAVAMTPAHVRRQLHGQVFSLLNTAAEDPLTLAHHALSAGLDNLAQPLLLKAAHRLDALNDPQRAEHLRRHRGRTRDTRDT